MIQRGILAVAVLVWWLGGAAWADGPPQRWAMPEPSRTVVVTRTIVIPEGTEVDFNYTRFVPARSLGDGSQREAQRPVMLLLKGASVRRVIIGRPNAHHHVEPGIDKRHRPVRVRAVVADQCGEEELV